MNKPLTEEQLDNAATLLMKAKMVGILLGTQLDRQLQSLRTLPIDNVHAGLHVAAVNWVSSARHTAMKGTAINMEEQRALFMAVAEKVFDEIGLIDAELKEKA